MDYVSLAFKLLQLAIEIYPELAQWLGDLTSGKTDPISIKVKDILPEKSESRKAAEALGTQ